MSHAQLVTPASWLKGLVALLFGLLLLAPVQAESAASGIDDSNPDQLMHTLTDTVISTLKGESEQIKQRPQRLYELVDELLIPHVDMQVMARWVLGSHWKSATPEQREAFTQEFRTLLTRFYVSALIDDPEKLDELLENAEKMIDYKPVKVDGRKAQVLAEITLSSGTIIPVTFSLYDKQGHWMLYDVNVDGISLVVNYRTTFASTLANSSLDELLAQMKSRNAELLEQEGGKAENAS